jgi:alpha-1,2-mannosyltransferase
MAFQALASVRVALQGLRIVLPEVYVDTTGWSFPYPFVRFAAAKVAAYVHYPTISQDMLNRVIHRQSLLHNSNCDSGGVTTATGGGGGRGAVNNNNSDDIYDDYDGRDLHALLMQEEESGGLVGSLFIMIKAAYYYVFAFVYSITGMTANVVMCNSNWTRDRIIQSWWKMGRRRKGRKKRRGNHISVEEEEEEEEEDALPMLVYPPCDTKALQALPLDRKLKRLFIISVAQFRPEKNHVLQLRAFAAARREVSSLKGVGVGGGGGGETMHMQLPTDNNNNKNTIGAAALEEDDEDDDNHNASTIAHSVLSTHLILVGGCRDREDQARVEQLKAMASTLGIADHVEFKLNVSRDQIKALLQEAIAGLHTMEDEHFGISIVEYMAAGVVPIVHDSGGPREDIVVPNIPCHFSYNNSGSDGGRKRHKDLIIPRMTDQCITNSNGYGYGYSSGYGGGGDTKAPFVNNIGGVGYRCRTENEYRDAIIQVVSMDQVDRLKIAEAARKKAECYSDEIFSDKFIQCISPLLQ